MKAIGGILLVIVLLLAILIMAPAALDAAAGLSDRQPLTLNVQQLQQLQQQIQPQVIIVQPEQPAPAVIDPTLAPAVNQPPPAVINQPAATATPDPAVIQANSEAMAAPAACGRRGCPGQRATATPGYGR
jgi:hypothetical protein